MLCAPDLGKVVLGYDKPDRPIDRVFIHCSATSNKRTTVLDVDQWHKGAPRYWNCCGYHYFIRSDGVIEQGRSLEVTPAAQEGHNTGTIAICLNGLTDLDFSSSQYNALRKLADEIWEAHNKKVTFHGHCEVSSKTCPVFKYKVVLNLDAAGRIKSTAVGSHLPPIKPAAPLDAASMTITRVPLGIAINVGHPHVRVLQGLLTAFSIRHPGPCDGDFGEKTKASVIAFQEESDLVPDGLVGAVTWEALEKL